MASKKVMVSICGDDRISSLPDGVLCHILSFLPTKYSVRTSLLSTRWKHLFTFVPSLDFKYSALITTPHGSNASNSISFIRFVSSVIMSYNVSCMNKFCFQFFDLEHAPPHFPIFSYISAVIRRHVQEIDISVTSSPRLTLPLDLFSSKTITKLMLQGRFNFVLPCSVSLTCLRTCILLNVRFDDESARRLFRSCPVLINLDLINCFVGDVVALDISVPTLEHLTFYESGEIDRLVLNVPKLLHFDYAGPTSVEFSGLESLKSLVDANIFSEPDSSTRHSNIVDLVRSVSHVQQLYLNCDVMEAFLCSGHSLPTFNNVTRIRFGYISCFSLRFLPGLLNSAPRVEFLTLEGSEDEENSTDENGHLSPLHVPACVSRCLKEVDFRFFGGLDYEFKLINYFLKYANNLKVMKMQTEVSWNEKFEISSAACQIVFYSDGL